MTGIGKPDEKAAPVSLLSRTGTSGVLCPGYLLACPAGTRNTISPNSCMVLQICGAFQRMGSCHASDGGVIMSLDAIVVLGVPSLLCAELPCVVFPWHLLKVDFQVPLFQRCGP